MALRVLAASPEELDACLALRRQVFCVEQGVEEALEVDGLDPQCLHVAAWHEGAMVGTARLRPLSSTEAKAERVAVLRAWRRRGVGKALMDALEQSAIQQGFSILRLHAQEGALPFYDAIGYHREGPMFEEAGIPHQEMWRSLPSVLPWPSPPSTT